MTDLAVRPMALRHPDLSATRLRRRYAAERRFRFYGILAVAVAAGMLGLLLGSILYKGYSAFYRTEIALPVNFDPAVIDPAGTRDPAVIAAADYAKIARDSLNARFPDVSSRADRRALSQLLAAGTDLRLRAIAMKNPAIIGTTATVELAASDDVDMLMKGRISRAVGEADRTLTDKQLAWMDELEADGLVAYSLNTTFFTAGDSREPEEAGVLGAFIGSILTMLVTLALAFPLAVATAVYLEEFAPKNRWTDLIEVNINNLAAVPSIVFGLLGLAIFLGFFGLPRSAPVVGGLVLALMTLPTIIIATRASLKAVPPSIREAAYGVGASALQVVTHHVVPLALPGILTGTIIGMARALGETAPLLMIGMVAFIVDVPKGFTDAATVLPVQVYLWADSPERGFVEKTSGAIIVLLVTLILMNGIAVFLRRRFERRW
ncbi:MAG: phosphate ABC transporter permease PstA [Dongiaceae bacterium]